MFKCLLHTLIGMSALSIASVSADVPSIIQFSSSISVSGTNFNGTGHFKFAFVDPAGSLTYWSHDGSSTNAVEPQSYLSLPVVTGQYSVFLGDTNLPSMMPVSASVFTNQAIHIRVWFSDGPSAFQKLVPDQIFTSVAYAMTAANVVDGAITAEKLADGSITAAKLASGAVTSESIAPGAVGNYQLKQGAAASNLGAIGGLVLSSTDNAQSMTAAGLQKIGKVMTEVDHWLTNAQYSPVAMANHSAVWTGREMILWGGSPNTYHPDVISALYNRTTDAWSPMGSKNYNDSSYVASSAATWNGKEMMVPIKGLVWKIWNRESKIWRNAATSNAPTMIDGISCTPSETDLFVVGDPGGAKRYNFEKNQWFSLSKSKAPIKRQFHTTVWTGSDLIVWGGDNGSGLKMNDGSIYNLASDTWSSMTLSNAPARRTRHKAVYTGRYMMIWGGQSSEQNYYGDNTGGVYDTLNGTWKSISTNNAPSGRFQFTSFWTGKEMVVWGGLIGRVQSFSSDGSKLLIIALTDGGKYNPATDTWTPIADAPLNPIAGYSAVWTGKEMLLYGGGVVSQSTSFSGLVKAASDYQSVGYRFNPDTGEWSYLPFTPTPRVGHSAVWTGSELLVWGGATNSDSKSLSLLREGGVFNPVKGTWRPISTLNAPTGRKNHQAVWTGKEMIVWSGEGWTNFGESTYLSIQPLNTGARYVPSLDKWLTMDTNGAPSPRTGVSAVWTGQEMIAFGGYNASAIGFTTNKYRNDGGIYDPATDTWKSISKWGAPSPRHQQAAVWTGDEMIIWGGEGYESSANPTIKALNTGARFNPIYNTWLPMSSGGPLFALTPLAAWSGSKMIVWGGSGNIPGSQYNPTTDRWEPMSVSNMPSTLYGTNTIWTGEELMVWSDQKTSSIHRYNPTTDQWQLSSKSGWPIPRKGHKAVWTGSEMLVFGGTLGNTLQNGVLRYQTTTPMYLYGKP